MSGGPLTLLALAIRRFEKGEIGVAEVQGSIVSNGSAVEGASQGLLEALRSAEAELEHVQHAMLLDQQRGAALEALGPLLRELERLGVSSRREVPSGALVARLDRDVEADTAYLYLSDVIPHGSVARSVECGPVVLDFDRLGRLVGIEVLSAGDVLPAALSAD